MVNFGWFSPVPIISVPTSEWSTSSAISSGRMVVGEGTVHPDVSRFLTSITDRFWTGALGFQVIPVSTVVASSGQFLDLLYNFF